MLKNILNISNNSIAIIFVGNTNDVAYNVARKIKNNIRTINNKNNKVKFIKIQSIYGMIFICNYLASKNNFDSFIIIVSSQSMSSILYRKICFNCFSQISLKFMMPIFFITDKNNNFEINGETKELYHLKLMTNHIHETLNIIACSV